MSTIFIGIAGGTGSGKTTLTRHLKEHFGDAVTADGLVTGVAKGKTVLKATVGDQSVSCFVIVN